MQIRTNIADDVKVHDNLSYPPIECQVRDYFANNFTVKHEIKHDSIILILNGYKCVLEIRKKGVTLSLLQPENGIKFGEKQYPFIKLPYNKDVGKKIENFASILTSIQALEKRAKALPKPPAKEVIETFLQQELDTSYTTVSFWQENLFTGTEITFYLHPKGRAPGDGVVACINKDNKIEPFWNHSTPRRSGAHIPEGMIEHAVGNNFTTDHKGMKSKIEKIEQLQAKVDAFDPSKSKDFMQLLDLKRQADELVTEFQKLVRGSK